jgi:hypothetical protein
MFCNGSFCCPFRTKNVIKKHGEPIEENVFIEIWLNDDGTLENWTK